MITLSSTGEVLDALQRGRDISLLAYTLPDGRVLEALDAAAARGARVRVRLEGYIYKDDGTVGARNAAAVAKLRAAGADAQLVHATNDARDPMLHLKAAVIDGTVFLDDRNWPDDGADTIVRDTFAGDTAIVRDAARGVGDAATRYFSVQKRQSLALEARLINAAGKGDEVIVESESFGAHNAVYRALEGAARRGAHVRVLVNARDLNGNSAEVGAVRALAAKGASIRACDADEKLAVVNATHGWLGSSNATVASGNPDQLDWGARTDNPALMSHARQAFESRWATATPAA
jgi:phosphatidylserine/phosphatidylglycerophosphate/cardiolipin synthase-like enzyme